LEPGGAFPLTTPRFFILLAAAFFLSIFQSSIVTEILPRYLRPDCMFLFIAYTGIFHPFIPGVILASFAGLVVDTFSGIYFGFFWFVALVIFFSVKTLGKILIMGETLQFRMSLVGFLMGFQTFLLSFVPLFLGISENLSFLPPGETLAQIVITCAVCEPFFRFMKKIESIPKEAPSSTIPDHAPEI
jgi:rod shape-determining protein MreD